MDHYEANLAFGSTGQSLYYPAPEPVDSAGLVNIIDNQSNIPETTITPRWGLINPRLGIAPSRSYSYLGKLELNSLSSDLVEIIANSVNEEGGLEFAHSLALLSILDQPAYLHRDNLSEDINAALLPFWKLRNSELAFYTPLTVTDVLHWYKSLVERRDPFALNHNIRVAFSVVSVLSGSTQSIIYEDKRFHLNFSPDSIRKAKDTMFDLVSQSYSVGSDAAWSPQSMSHNVIFFFAPRSEKTIRQGAFFPYILDMSLPESKIYEDICMRYQIYNSNCTLSLSNACCLEYAINIRLRELGYPPILIDRFYINGNNVRTIWLKDIAIQSKIRISLHRCRKAEDITTPINGKGEKFGKEGPEINLFLIMDHYMIFDKDIVVLGDQTTYSSTRTLVLSLLQRNLLRSMENPELLMCSPKEIDINSVYEITPNTDFINKTCVKLPNETEHIPTMELIEQVRVLRTLNNVAEEAKKRTAAMQAQLDARYPFKGEAFYYVAFDTETANYGNKVIPYLLKWDTYICRRVDDTLQYEYEYLEENKVFSKTPATFLYSYLNQLRPIDNETEVNVRLMAHNLGFDMSSFWAVFGKFEVCLGTRSKPKQIQYVRHMENKEKHTYIFNDSYFLIKYKLERFPSLFNLTGDEATMAKMAFPYNYFSGELVDKMLSGREYVPLLEFLDNCSALGYSREELTRTIAITKAQIEIKDAPMSIKRNMLRGIKYINLKILALGYCSSDVKILAQGYIACMNQLRDTMDIVPEKYCTTASWAYAYLTQHGGLKDCPKLSGELRLYISNAIYGGRCLTRENKSWHLIARTENGGWVYFDGVSLYPSAMIRMGGVPLGGPDLVTDDVSLIKQNLDCPYFVCTLDILSHPAELPFPLLVQRDEKGNNYTNNYKGKIVLTKYDLQILTLFGYKLGVHYNITFGVFWNKLSMGIGDVIGKLFYRRVDLRDFNARKPDGSDYTNEERDAHVVLKEAMNSCFGKSIQKFYSTMLRYHVDTVDFEDEDEVTDKDFLFTFDEMVQKYGDDVRSVTEVFSGPILRINKEGKPYESIENHTEVRVAVQGNDASNKCQVGAAVLSMARLIMAEVFWCVNELEKEDTETSGVAKKYVFYTDTDSMLIDVKIIKRLEDLYRRKFGRELVGKNAGQFHSDFEPPSSRKVDGVDVKYNISKDYIPRSIESYIIGKKFYSHKVQFQHMEQKEVKYASYLHNRLKGVPDGIRNSLGQSDYERIYYGAILDVDLLEGGKKVRFKFDPSSNQMRKYDKFDRSVKRIIEEKEEYTA